MDIDAITQLAFQRFGAKQTHPDREHGHSFYHGQRVAKLSLTLRRQLFPDDSSQDGVIYAGALFHDAEKGNEPHNETGAALVRELLLAYCSAVELDAVATIVRLHNQRGSVDDRFVRIVQDADVLDHEGTLGLWLLFTVTASRGESVPHALEFWERQLKHDPAEPKLNYTLSRAIFQERLRYFNAVVERLRAEADGQIPGIEA
jgi:uncharacterized protein